MIYISWANYIVFEEVKMKMLSEHLNIYKELLLKRVILYRTLKFVHCHTGADVFN